MSGIKNIVRSNILKLKPYSSARNEFSGQDAILLDANESPYNGPYNRYPDPRQSELKQKLAPMLGIDVSQLFLGNGSDEAIDLLYRVFCIPGKDRVCIIEPSYGMYTVCADINDVGIDYAPLEPDFRMKPEKVLAATGPGSKMVFLCSPNNPTSNLLDKESILEVLEGFGGLVIVDEAYIDFSGSRGLIHLLEDHQNLVILRTLSKAWAGAGIRLGMAIADPQIISLMDKIKYPYNINLLTQKKAIEILDNENDKKKWVEILLREREKLREELESMPLIKKVFPSDANFIMVKMDDPAGVYEYLSSSGVVVRNRSTLLHCEGCLRITVGTGQENRQLIEKLKLYSYEKGIIH